MPTPSSAFKSQQRILLAMGWYDHRLHCGIAKYAVERGWHLCPDATKEKVIPWGWRGDGILAWLGAGDDLARFVARARKPTVDFSFRRPHLRFPSVLVDHQAVANLAAEHLLSRGLTYFCFYSNADNWAFEENGRAFVEAVESAGHSCKWLRWHRSSSFTRGRSEWKDKGKWLVNELMRLPQPVGVFAATDGHALEVLEACGNAELSAPEQVSIVGVNNSLLAVDSMQTPITSIDTNLELVGYRGAELLEALMAGAEPPKQPIRVAPLGIVTRKSSDLVAVSHRGVARGLRFLLDQSFRQIGVDDLARAAGMSRRSLHGAFIKHLGRPPSVELQRIRIERAKLLLADADKPIDEIPNQCGYKSANSFWVAFKRATGTSPARYRNQLKRISGIEL